MNQASILVVEDESIVSLSLCAILELLGYHIAGSAVSGEDAVQKVEQARPDLVLMDIHLAGMLDGTEAATMIRQRYHVPVIFLTAYSDAETLLRARQAEPFGYIVKPFREQDLHSAITIALAKHAAEQRLLQSQQRYRDIAEDMPVLVCRFQPDGALTFVNPLFSRYFAQPLEKLVGMNFFQFIPSEEHERVRARYLALTVERPVTTYYRVLSPDGSLRWLRRTDRAIFDVDNQLLEYQMVGEDITEQRQAEESLRQSESKFRDVVQQSQDGIALTDEEGLIIEWNPAMERATGRSLFQVLGKPLWEVQFQSNPDLPADPGYEQEVRQALQTGQAPWVGKAVEREYPRSDGSRRYLQSVTFPIRTLKGYMLGSILRDVTERRRAEDAERAARRQAETLRQAMQALTSGGCGPGARYRLTVPGSGGALPGGFCGAAGERGHEF
jgi:PAS domain S-box-containing protein